MVPSYSSLIMLRHSMKLPPSESVSKEREKTLPLDKVDGIAQLTDRSIVVTLIALGFKYKFFRGSRKTVFEFDDKETFDIREQWKLDIAIPIDDVRKIFRAEASFNSAVHDD